MEHIPLPLLLCQVWVWNIQDKYHSLLFRIVPHPVLKGVIEDDHTRLGPIHLSPAYLHSTIHFRYLQSKVYPQPEKGVS